MADHNVDEIKVKVRVIEEEEPLGKLFRIFLWMERWKGYFIYIAFEIKIFRYLQSFTLFQYPACHQPQHWVI